MSYTINKTDGSKLTDILDGTIDQTASDLTLIGKNTSTYGELFNENMVYLLENFANTTPPPRPIAGQLWFDTSDERLKVYNGIGFNATSGTVVASSAPSTLTQGDLWIDTTRRQMYFHDGFGLSLAGPAYTAQQGVSGFIITEVYDVHQIKHTLVLLYVSKILLGIFSSAAFTLAKTIPGYNGTLIDIGFNSGSLSGIKFKAPVETSAALLDSIGTSYNAENFMKTNTDTDTVGTISVINSTPLVLGPASNNEIKVSNLKFELNSNVADQDIQFNIRHNNQLLPGVHINALHQRVGIFTNTPNATLDVTGDAIIQGSLTVKGELTTVKSTVIDIVDRNIELGKVDNPTDLTADGGGITVKGTTDKTFNWVGETAAWTSSDNMALISGKSYKIGTQDVLSLSSLGITVTSAPGLTSIGQLTSLQVDYVNINSDTISYVNPIIQHGDIILLPKGNGSVNVSNKKLINVASPTNETDAVNLVTLTTAVKVAPLGLTINNGILSNEQIASVYINKIYPPTEHQSGAICRILCIDTGVIKEYELSITNVWVWQTNI